MVRIFVLPTNYPWVGAMGEAPGAHKHKFLPIIRSGNGKFLGFGEPKAPDADKMKGRFPSPHEIGETLLSSLNSECSTIRNAFGSEREKVFQQQLSIGTLEKTNKQIYGEET